MAEFCFLIGLLKVLYLVAQRVARSQNALRVDPSLSLVSCRAAPHLFLLDNLFCLALLQPTAPSLHALCSCSAPSPSISLSVCLIAGDGHVVYLTQNRTPLLFQRVEPPSPGQDGGTGLNNALPPPETTETVNGL